MKASRVLRHVLVCAAVIGTLWLGSQVTQGQGQPANSSAAGQPANSNAAGQPANSNAAGQPPDSTAGIQSLAEAGETLAVKSTSEKTGFVTFASSPGRGILRAGGRGGRRRSARDELRRGLWRAFRHRRSIAAVAVRASQKDEIGIEHVRFQQLHQGVPVRGGEFIVHLNGSRVTAANGLVVRDLPDDVVPNITAGGAQDAARQLIAKYKPADAAGRSVQRTAPGNLQQGVLKTGVYPSRLAWFVEATDLAAAPVHLGGRADRRDPDALQPAHRREVAHGLHRRRRHDAAGHAAAQRRRPGNRRRGRRQRLHSTPALPTTTTPTNHGRDSFDNAGGQLISTVHAAAPATPAHAERLLERHPDGLRQHLRVGRRRRRRTS